jgi:hypothetical protein
MDLQYLAEQQWVMQKEKKQLFAKIFLKNHFEFSVTEIRTRAQGYVIIFLERLRDIR